MYDTQVGIYLIENTTNGKVYVGSSIELPVRRYKHWWALNRGVHGNEHLLNAWRKYGADAFNYAVLEYCAPETLQVREDWWIDLLGGRNPDRGYNLWSASRQEMAPQTRTKLSLALAGESNPNYGKPRSPETRARISASLTGQVRGEYSQEHRAKISAAVTGKPGFWTGKTGPWSAKKRPPHSPETKEKMSAARSKWHADRRTKP